MGKFLVFTNAADGRDDEYNKWYDEVHAVEMCALPEYTGVTRYRLTDAQISLLKAWADGGAPEGDTRNKPVPPRFPEGWQAGEPDQVVSMTSSYSVAADGPDVLATAFG